MRVSLVKSRVPPFVCTSCLFCVAWCAVRKPHTGRLHCLAAMLAAVLVSSTSLFAAAIAVPAGGDLQQALNRARPGDTVTLAAARNLYRKFRPPRG